MSVRLAPRARILEKATWPGVSRKVIFFPDGSVTAAPHPVRARDTWVRWHCSGGHRAGGHCTEKGARMLGDAARFASGHIGLPQRIEQRGLAMVDVAHDRHDRRAHRPRTPIGRHRPVSTHIFAWSRVSGWVGWGGGVGWWGHGKVSKRPHRRARNAPVGGGPCTSASSPSSSATSSSSSVVNAVVDSLGTFGPVSHRPRPLVQRFGSTPPYRSWSCAAPCRAPVALLPPTPRLSIPPSHPPSTLRLKRRPRPRAGCSPTTYLAARRPAWRTQWPFARPQ